MQERFNNLPRNHLTVDGYYRTISAISKNEYFISSCVVWAESGVACPSLHRVSAGDGGG